MGTNPYELGGSRYAFRLLTQYFHVQSSQQAQAPLHCQLRRMAVTRLAASKTMGPPIVRLNVFPRGSRTRLPHPLFHRAFALLPRSDSYDNRL